MNKKTKRKLSFIAFIVIFSIFPITLFLFMYNSNEKSYYKYSREDLEVCLQQAREDKLSTEFCFRSKSAADNAYSVAVRVYFPIIIMLFSLTSSLSIGLMLLKVQIEELKEKLNV